MTQFSMGHNVEYLRRLAKTIKKQENITHSQSLDKVAVSKGFNNWKHLLHKSKENKLPKSSMLEKIVSNESSVGINRIDPYRNLLIAAVNELLKGKHISLNPDLVNSKQEKGHVFLNLFGHPSVIIWRDGGFDELLISVWWKYNHDKHPQAKMEGNYKESFNLEMPLAKHQDYKKFVGVTASCWMERRSGQYLQGENREYLSYIYTRKGELKQLKELPYQKPMGYESTGSFRF